MRALIALPAALVLTLVFGTNDAQGCTNRVHYGIVVTDGGNDDKESHA